VEIILLKCLPHGPAVRWHKIGIVLERIGILPRAVTAPKKPWIEQSLK
jgi:hypothetical protein